MSLVRKLARPMLASSFIVSGVDRLRDPDSSKHLTKLVDLAASTTPQLSVLKGQEELVGKVLAGSQVAAGVLFALGKFPRLAATQLFLTGAINSYIEYRATEVHTEDEKVARRNAALAHGSLLGAIAISAVDTEGNPSLVWRASRLSDKVASKSSQIASDVQDVAHDAQKKVSGLLAV